MSLGQPVPRFLEGRPRQPVGSSLLAPALPQGGRTAPLPVSASPPGGADSAPGRYGAAPGGGAFVPGRGGITPGRDGTVSGRGARRPWQVRCRPQGGATAPLEGANMIQEGADSAPGGAISAPRCFGARKSLSAKNFPSLAPSLAPSPLVDGPELGARCRIEGAEEEPGAGDAEGERGVLPGLQLAEGKSSFRGAVRLPESGADIGRNEVEPAVEDGHGRR